jgi:hypothetical protein
MDIPLREAQILWDYSGREPDAPSIIVVGADAGRWNDRDYLSSWGCCNGEFADANETDKLRLLFAKFVELVTVEGLDPRNVHGALMVIPEYREGFGWSGLGGYLTEPVA